VAPARRPCASYEVQQRKRATISHARTFTDPRNAHKLRTHWRRPAEAIITSEKERLVARIDDIRSMLRDAKSLDVIEMLLLALADCEQRVAWIDGEDAVTVEPASARSAGQDTNAPQATPSSRPPDTANTGRVPPPA
jgi:hypothetical protein